MGYVTLALGRVLAALAAAVLAAAPAASQQTLENDVKAAFLYNFTKFVEWPEDRLPRENFRVCVVGNKAFAAAVDATIAGETAYGRPLVRHDPQSADEARTCQILYVGNQEPDRGARLLAGVRQMPVLTVGESSRFGEQGGHIRFLLEQNKVRFDVSVPAAERSGLRLSSQLLRVARRVDPGAPR